MPANVIIFDAAYIAEMTSGMNIACTLVNEAVNFLRRASLHEGWKCKECVKISENLDDLNIRLGRLDEGVNETTRILGGSVSRFEALEERYRTQAESLSDDLRNNYGFQASGYSPSGQNTTTTTTTTVGTGSTIAGGTIAGKTGTGTVSGREGVSNTPSSPAQPAGQPAPQQEARPTTGTGRPNVNVNISRPSGNTRQDSIPQENTPVTPAGQPTAQPAGRTAPGVGSVNLPVTHIPSRPDAAVTGLKTVKEMETVAVTGVTESIIGILGGNVNLAEATPEQREEVIRSIVNVYTTGRSVAESSAAIIADPSQPHIKERITMATGIVSLANGTATGTGIIPVPEQTVTPPAGTPSVSTGTTPAQGGSPTTPQQGTTPKAGTQSVSTGTTPTQGRTSATPQQGGTVSNTTPAGTPQTAPAGRTPINAAAISTNAEDILQNMGDDEPEEVREMLQTLTSKGAGGSSGGSSGSSNFLDKVKSTILDRMKDDGLSFGILGSLSLREFLEKVV